jgi:hypothetical protein
MATSIEEARHQSSAEFTAVSRHGHRPLLFDELRSKRATRADAAPADRDAVTAGDPGPEPVTPDAKPDSADAVMADLMDTSPLRRTIETLKSQTAASTAMTLQRESPLQCEDAPQPHDSLPKQRLEALQKAASNHATRIAALETARARRDTDKTGQAEMFAELRYRIANLETAASEEGSSKKVDVRTAAGVVFVPSLVFGTTFGFAIAMLFL